MGDFDGAVRNGGIGAPLIEVREGLGGNRQRIFRGQAPFGPVPAQGTRGRLGQILRVKAGHPQLGGKIGHATAPTLLENIGQRAGRSVGNLHIKLVSGWSPDASTAPARCMVPFAKWPFSDRILIEFPLMSTAPMASCTTSLPVESAPIWTVPERSGHCTE